MNFTNRLTWIRPFAFAMILLTHSVFAETISNRTIVVAQPEDQTVRFAAAELQRYLYLRTGVLLEIDTEGKTAPQGTTFRLSVVDDQYAEQEYEIQTVGSQISIQGGDGVAVLYGTYRMLEHFGIRFYLHGDVVPDKKIPFTLPEIAEKQKPLFALRGVNPWGSHPFGFDQWSTNDYIVHIGQLAKMRMNFIGMHCYPEKAPYAEPTVWVGRDGDFDAQGNVSFSYPSRYFSTAFLPHWGAFLAKSTRDYIAGADRLFTGDTWGPDVMRGIMPEPASPEDCNLLFNRMGRQFADAFAFARFVGVKTCIGTEAPLTIPRLAGEKLVAEGKNPQDPETVKDVYKGIFRRIAATHPLDYYWLWTNENWTWLGNSQEETKSVIDDILLANQALDEIGRPFELATSGWAVGPIEDRSLWDRSIPKRIPISAISRRLGHDPVDEAFGRIERKDKWAIPWMESDTYHGLANPQIFVARTRKDAADALAYGCSGLMGLQWRTMELSPNIAALAQAGWNQDGWNPSPGTLLPNVPPAVTDKSSPYILGGLTANYPEAKIEGTDEEFVYRSCVYNMDLISLPIPNGKYRVTLKFCEPHFNTAGQRVGDVFLQENKVLSIFDIFTEAQGQFKALDRSFEDVAVTDSALSITFTKIVSMPCVSGVVVEGKRDDGTVFVKKFNCGGAAWKDFMPIHSRHDDIARSNRGLPSFDFWYDWAKNMFGDEIAEDAARLFDSIDGCLPMANADGCPAGSLSPWHEPWEEIRLSFAFVDAFSKLRSRITSPGNLERFDFWNNFFHFNRQQAELRCTLARFNETARRINSETDPGVKDERARKELFPLFDSLKSQYVEMTTYLQQAASTPGGLMTIVYMEQCTFWRQTVLDVPKSTLEKLLAERIPEVDAVSREYRGSPRIFIPTLRTSSPEGHELLLEVKIHSASNPKNAVLHWKKMGTNTVYQKVNLQSLGGSNYSVRLPKLDADLNAIEYFIAAEFEGDGKTVRFPATAPGMNQTLILQPSK